VQQVTPCAAAFVNVTHVSKLPVWLMSGVHVTVTRSGDGYGPPNGFGVTSAPAGRPETLKLSGPPPASEPVQLQTSSSPTAPSMCSMPSQIGPWLLH
jgi:hypothetical protein